MNILITPDIPEWAIGKLTDGITKYNKRFNFFTIPVHPRGMLEGYREVSALLRDTQIHLWHGMYWNSAKKLLEAMPELKSKKKVLSHHNHHCLKKDDWKDWDTVIAPTKYSLDKLKEMHDQVSFIPYGVDLDNFNFIEQYPPQEPAVGYIGRVMPHKNLDKITVTADELGYKVIGSGYIEKTDYWNSIFKDNLKFNGGIGRGEIPPVGQKDELYRQMSVFVMYSTGEKETGTLPLFEAMARGIPVLATEQGTARDIIKDGENGIIFDESNFKEKLKMLMENEPLRQKLRRNAWDTIKNFTEERMAREYAKAYYKTMWGDKPVISVVIPTFNRAENLADILISISLNNYGAKEIIVCDDGSNDNTAEVVAEAKKRLPCPILYLRTGKKLEYGLARSRNMGAIEALGDILLFLDDRYEVEPDCLETVAKNAVSKYWNFGVKIIKGKASTKKSFVENFSWVRRDEFIAGGMFNERMDMYGGMSQEIRTRFKKQGFKFNQIEKARVKMVVSSPRYKKRDEIWRMKLKLYKMYG